MGPKFKERLKLITNPIKKFAIERKILSICILVLILIFLTLSALLIANAIKNSKQVAPKPGYAGKVGEPCRGDGFIKTGDCLKCLSAQGYRSQLFCQSNVIVDLPRADQECNFLCSYTVCQSWGYKEDFYCQAKDSNCPIDKGICCLNELSNPIICYDTGECAEKQTCDTTQNKAPVCQGIIKQPNINNLPNQGGEVTLTVDAYDPDNDILFYTWGGDDLSGQAKEVIWNIPPNNQGQSKTYTAWVSITDGISEKSGGEGTNCSTQITVPALTDYTLSCEKLTIDNKTNPGKDPKTNDTVIFSCLAKSNLQTDNSPGPEIKMIKFIINQNGNEITQLSTTKLSNQGSGLYKGSVEYTLIKSGSYRVTANLCLQENDDQSCQI